jgi:hypothetical protein
MDSHDKTRSKLQKKLNNVRNVNAKLTLALEKRKKYTVNADRFIRMLLHEGRTTTEELQEYFKPIKKKK